MPLYPQPSRIIYATSKIHNEDLQVDLASAAEHNLTIGPVAASNGCKIESVKSIMVNMRHFLKFVTQKQVVKLICLVVAFSFFAGSNHCYLQRIFANISSSSTQCPSCDAHSKPSADHKGSCCIGFQTIVSYDHSLSTKVFSSIFQWNCFYATGNLQHSAPNFRFENATRSISLTPPNRLTASSFASRAPPFA